MTIERSEYLARQDAARRSVRSRGYAGLVAWSRGGSTQDHYAEVYYLTGFYTHYPFIPDEPLRWRARGHTALVLPVDGPTILIVDVAERQDPQPVADHVVFAEDVVATLAGAIRESIRAGAEVAMIGAEAVAWPWWNELQKRISHHLVNVAGLGAELRMIKTRLNWVCCARLVRPKGHRPIAVATADDLCRSIDG